MERTVELSNRELRKAIYALALPIVWSNLLQRGVGIIDAVMVGHLGAPELAAVGMAQLVVMLLMALPMGIGTGTMIIVANATGEKDPEKRCRAAGSGLAMGVLFSIFLSILSYALSYQMAIVIGASGKVAVLAKEYLQIISIFFIAKSLIYILSSIFQGSGDSRTPLSVIIWVNILHIIIAYPLIYGLNISGLGLSIQAWGVKGAAFASGITELGGALVLFWKSSKKNLIQPRKCRIGSYDHKKIINLGIPVFFERILTSSMQMVYARLVVSFSVAAYAAHQVGLNIESISWLPGLGFAQAATTMVGQNLGAQQPKSAKRVGYQSHRVALIFMTVLGASYLLFPQLWVRLFTSDPEVIKYGTIYCFVTAFCQPPLATAMVMAGALRGAGNTRFVMGSTILGAWVVRLPFAYIAGILLSGGIVWVWIAMVLDWSARSAALLWRYRREKSFVD
jgi:putative MATE family efflux protein